MKSSFAFIPVLISLAVAGRAQDVKIPNESGEPRDPGWCDTQGYDCREVFEYLVLATDEQYCLGPASTVGGDMIEDVILEITLYQTWVGDLIVGLSYDADLDGLMDVGPAVALCRPNLAGCSIDGCCGCSGDVIGTYQFSDAGSMHLGEPDCWDSIPNGCYLPAPDPEVLGWFDIFAGLPTGGDFYLMILDAAEGDNTNLIRWQVCLKVVEPTAIHEVSWGRVKSLYGR